MITTNSEYESILTNLRWVTPCKKINSPVIHREFTIDSVDENANLLISGLGYFEVYLNGKKAEYIGGEGVYLKQPLN